MSVAKPCHNHHIESELALELDSELVLESEFGLDLVLQSELVLGWASELLLDSWHLQRIIRF